MGNLSIVFVSYFLLYLSFSCSTYQNGVEAAIKQPNLEEEIPKAQLEFNKFIPKRAHQFYGLNLGQGPRREKSFTAPDFEFVDDADFDKRAMMDDYGHLRFGKRGQDWQDYGHLRFGKR